jgi:hypothetical protein
VVLGNDWRPTTGGGLAAAAAVRGHVVPDAYSAGSEATFSAAAPSLASDTVRTLAPDAVWLCCARTAPTACTRDAFVARVMHPVVSPRCACAVMYYISKVSVYAI